MNVVLDGFIVNNQSKAKTNLESEIVELRESVARLEKQLSVAKEEVETQKKSEGNWRTLAENSLDQIMILDLDYTIQFINYTSYGVKRENILGKSPLHFVPPDQHQVCIDCFKEVIKSGKPGRYETRYVTDEKETHHYDVRVAPITREDGKVTGLIISFNDITNNNRMKDLLESEEKHRNLFETMVQGVVYQAGDGSIISANTAAERILGVTLAQLQGRTSMDPSWKSIREDGSDFPGDQHPSMTALKTGKKVIGVVMGVFNPKKQDNTWMKVNAVPRFHEGEEKPFQVFTTFEDITHSKNLEEQLKKSYNQLIDLKENAETANKLKSQFLANMSHDIRTPLNAVMGFTDLLSKKDQPKESREYLNKIKSSSRGLLNLINDILDFSKIEVGLLNIYCKTFLVKELMDGIMALFEMQFKKKGVQFNVQVSPGIPEAVYNDIWRINQVLTNILSNALKFTNKGRVDFIFNYKEKPGLLVFKIKDTGTGITSQKLDVIFDPFTQIGSDEQSKKGTGLGLAICKKLVGLIKGTLEVTSTYGEGTEFTVEIPANLQQVEKIRCISALQEIGETNIDKKKGNKILIVDDNPVNMELIKEQFAKTGFKNLLSASNGKEAIELALQHKPDLTLMDIQMPLMNGNEAIAHLKEKGFNEPIIALSAYAMKEDIDNSMKAGAAGYITKPIDFEKFFPRIAAFLKEKEPLSTPSTTSTMSTSSTPSTPSTPSTTSTTSTMSTMSTPTANPERNTRYIIKDSISTRIKGIFLQDVKDKIQVIKKILQEGKLEEEERNRIKSIAHGYKGNAGYFELRELAKISMELDQSIKENAPDHMIITKSKSLNRMLMDICNDNKPD